MAEGPGRVVAVALVVDAGIRGVLERVASLAKGEVRRVLRASIVPAAADGAGTAAIARRLAVSQNTVRKWRGRLAERGMEGLKDAPRSGRPRRYDGLVRVAVIGAATSTPAAPFRALAARHRRAAGGAAGGNANRQSPAWSRLTRSARCSRRYARPARRRPG
ncbi:helix-turn-helix domain-containing protein [Streptomyces hygroscopicus]|uniref:helix-turn-helix domain-containing protein n=1 Tax=Streptomyces hygroscopicus TaxID=1912 RepID=UPI0036AF124E